MLRLLQRPVLLRPAGPRARRVLWMMLACWVALNVADWATTAAVLARAGSHEGNPLQAALLARSGLAALAGYKALVIASGGALTWLDFRLWPRVFVALIVMCVLLVAAAVANTGSGSCGESRRIRQPLSTEQHSQRAQEAEQGASPKQNERRPASRHSPSLHSRRGRSRVEGIGRERIRSPRAGRA